MNKSISSLQLNQPAIKEKVPLKEDRVTKADNVPLFSSVKAIKLKPEPPDPFNNSTIRETEVI